MRAAVITACAAFALAAGLLALTRGDGSAAPTPAATAAPDLPPVRPGAPVAERIAALRADIRARPDHPDAYLGLAAAQLQRLRETSDPSAYAQADRAVGRANELAPRDPSVAVLRASLALSRHDFAAGLREAELAHRLAPTSNASFAPRVDGLVELGRYDEAASVLQTWLDRKPDLSSLARLSYLRELHGDVAGAADALDAALSAGGQVPEHTAYIQSLRGALELTRGRLSAARRSFLGALASVPRYAPAEAGLAKVQAARGDLPAAIGRLRRVVERLPAPEHVVALAELELAAGRRAAAEDHLALAAAQRRLQRAAGVNLDAEEAVAEADHGDPRRAVVLARRGYAAAPSLRSADALGWALTRAGDPRAGLRAARRALSLASRDPAVRLHAGVAALGAGARGEARRHLRIAVAGAPALGPWRARAARAALREARS